LFFEQAKPYWKRFVLVYAISLGSEVSLLVVPVMMKGFLNAMVAHQAASEVSRWLLLVCAARVSALVLGRAAFPIERSVVTKLMVALESLSLRRILEQSYAFFTDVPSGQVLTKIQRLAPAMNRLHDIFLYTYLNVGVNFLFLVILGISRAPVLAFIAIGYGVASSLVAWIVSRRIRPLDRANTEVRSKLTGMLADILGQGVTVLLFSSQKREEKRFLSHADEFLATWRRRWMANWQLMSFQRALVVAFELSVLWVIFLGWRDGWMTVGDVVMYQGIVAILISQIRGFHDSIRQWHDASVEAQEAMDLLNREPEVKDLPGATATQ
jgi:ABC-type multidrug transport system fused ATPase/permease subunit